MTELECRNITAVADIAEFLSVIDVEWVETIEVFGQQDLGEMTIERATSLLRDSIAGAMS